MERNCLDGLLSVGLIGRQTYYVGSTGKLGSAAPQAWLGGPDRADKVKGGVYLRREVIHDERRDNQS